MRFESIDQAISEQKLWRAKEILQGRLSHPEVDLALFHKYGEVLLEMNDFIEAGRMLFRSGARDERFREAIDIFLSRNDRREPQRFLARLPSSMRRQRHLAEFVASPEFERSGWTAVQLSHIVPIQTDVDARPCQRSHRMTSILAIVSLVCLLALSLVGLYTTIGSAVRLFADW
ncbi:MULTISPECIES: hypothetical protein [Agrobacterium]|uniref:Uncharacterized protein n=1 Tax=Agrobacterium pusense TaxID=648995 RepID=A0A6H0ZJ50_9HYPH|nr:MULTISPECIES: hypothetical protein [Agrobacterium]ANV23173.1 hypothetical protein BA939_04000 [Rhizobium sp. S41]KGE80778.1 hypothetical protein LW14_20805 [Rhizobium sp. H41]HAU78759.1 hypothetical protein [Agrobacterium sp.]MDH0869006.1 hypothetical protein [Agrobacterium pusense]MDH1267781.1 hypothetical protein [Agrobacterium pusense]